VLSESSQPRRIGRYLLYGPIASGGMATVHLGRLVGEAGFSRTVAIKRLHPRRLSPFIAAGKAVFHVEYGASSLTAAVCPDTRQLGFSTLIKELDLGVFRVACP
jgi:hypothetical protein